MNDNTNAAADTASTPEAAPKAPPKEIVRGRMPVAIVAQVRFGLKKGESTKALADLFGTTVGKIDDIKKNRNFAYVTKGFKPTEQQKQDGLAWLKRNPNGEQADLVTELEGTAVASAEEAAAFETARSGARGQKETTAEGAPADAGGGNRRGKGKSKGEDAPAAATGDALLS